MEFKFEIENNVLELLGRQTESISPRSEKAFCRKNHENVILCKNTRQFTARKERTNIADWRHTKKNSLKN